MDADQTLELARAVLAINHLDRGKCLDKWSESFDRPAPKYLSLQFMKRVLIWNLQNQMLGDVSAKTERRLKQIAAGQSVPVTAKPTSHLVREWKGLS